jgi:alkylhydroperoxidase family enzyme
MTTTPQAVDDATFARARAQFSPEELVELVATAAWENAVSRFNHAFGVEAIGLWQPRSR